MVWGFITIRVPNHDQDIDFDQFQELPHAMKRNTPQNVHPCPHMRIDIAE